MKLSVILASLIAVIAVFKIQAEEALPPKLSFDRYSKMADHSPFALASAVAAPATTPDFAKDLYIANAAHSADGDLVTLASSSDHNFKKYLTTREPVDGYSITNIEWSDKVGATKVTISKDGNFATITFNQALLSQSGPNPGAPGRPVSPPMAAAPLSNPIIAPGITGPKLPGGVPAQLQQLIPSGADTVRSPPHSRGLIPRSPRPAKPSAAGAAPGAKN